MKAEAHQFLPSLGWRDAVGTHTLETRRALASAGISGGIWAEEVHGHMARSARPPDGYPRRRSARRGGNVIVYQASTGSDGVAAFVGARPEAKVLYYHNVTPARFFEHYQPAAAVNLAWGREELERLVPRCRVFMANSEFSALDLKELGATDIRVMPPYLPPSVHAAPNPTHAAWLRKTKRGSDLLTVARIAPNKGHAHLLRAFAAYRAAVDPHARLFAVGAWGPEPYIRKLFALRRQLDLEGVAFVGSVTDETLAAHYQEADVYVSMSEHEGFGLPLVEAMRKGLPVVAYAGGGAVAETMGGGGLLVGTLDPPTVAEVVARLAGDDALRESVLRAQARRLAALDGVPRDAMVVQAVQDAAGA
ncbi:MAG: glycosyltransferase [Acidimicrobiales bacterium]